MQSINLKYLKALHCMFNFFNLLGIHRKVFMKKLILGFLKALMYNFAINKLLFRFSLQSVCKALIYAIALNELGRETVHK